MTAIAAVKYGARNTVRVENQTVDIPYFVKGAATHDDARSAIIAAAPGTVTGYQIPGSIGVPTLVQLEVSADEQVSPNGLWEGVARYGLPTGTQRKQPGESSFQFETGGATQRITQGLKHISTTKTPIITTAPDYKGAINVDGDGNIGGTDIVTPVFRFSLTVCFTATAVSQAYLNTLYSLTGKVNTASVTITINGQTLTFAAGELLFEGASGGMRGTADWEITFRLAASPNVTDVRADWASGIKPASAVPKKGWEYAWIAYQPSVDTSAFVVIRKPIAVMVEQVYKTGDLTQLNIP